MGRTSPASPAKKAAVAKRSDTAVTKRKSIVSIRTPTENSRSRLDDSAALLKKLEGCEAVPSGDNTALEPEAKTPPRGQLKRSNSNLGDPCLETPEKRLCPAASNEVSRDCVEEAVKEGISMHESLVQILRSGTRRRGGSWNKGAEAAGEAASKMYWELLNVFNRLLPAAKMGTSTEHETAGQTRYSVYEFNGEEVGKRMDMSKKLAKLRSRGLTEEATDALLAVLSCLGSRKEMCWIEDFEDERPIRGHFAHAVADPQTTLRLSCVHIGERIFPASLIMSENIPMRAALEGFDNDGPLKEAPARFGSKYEFALQTLVDDENLGTLDGRIVDERQSVRDLVACPKLTEVIQKNVPVIMIDSFLALAPREVAAQEGLSDVVKAELEAVLRRAKADGIPVILQLGGEEAHMLAKKVYMRPNFAQHGLRCGYIRWRPSATSGWGKEQVADSRCCIALQLP